MSWPKENIPNNSILFCRIHNTFISLKTKKPSPSAFFNTPKTGTNLSSDWNKYSTAQQSRNRIGKQFRFGTTKFKNKEDFFIYQFQVIGLRGIFPKQKVEHSPTERTPELIGSPNNRSHSVIIGDKGNNNDPEIRLKLMAVGEWAISP